MRFRTQPLATFWVPSSSPDDGDQVYAPGDRSPQAVVARRRAVRAEARRRQAAGTFSAFTDEEMDRARDLTHYAPNVADDPVAEILGHPSDRQPGETPTHGVERDEWAALRAVGVAAGGVVPVANVGGVTFVEFEEAIRRLSEAMADMSLQVSLDALSQAVTAFDPAVDDDPPEVVNRRLHGNSAFCPRHGETKGGLCRRCR